GAQGRRVDGRVPRRLVLPRFGFSGVSAPGHLRHLDRRRDLHPGGSARGGRLAASRETPPAVPEPGDPVDDAVPGDHPSPTRPRDGSDHPREVERARRRHPRRTADTGPVPGRCEQRPYGRGAGGRVDHHRPDPMDGRLRPGAGHGSRTGMHHGRSRRGGRVAASHRPRDATATHAGIGQHRYELTGKDVRVRTDATPTTETLWAKVLSEVFAPWVIVIVLSGTVAWEATHALPAAAAWGLLVALTSSVIPMGVIVWGARRGRWDGHHVRNREGRLVPLSTLIALSGLGLALLLVLDAPWLVVALDIAMLVCLV